MTHSDSIDALAAALAKAQGAMAGAKKDSDNPYFKSKYADLASVWDACRKTLSDNGLSVAQTVGTIGDKVSVTTMLMHASGQWIADELVLTPKDDGPQAFGSAITYGRRYALAAFVGVAPEDDDGEAAQGRVPGRVVTQAPPKPHADSGPLVVTRVTQTPTSRKGMFRYVVEFSNGKTAATIKEQLGALAQQLSETGEVVKAVIDSGKYGPELIALTRETRVAGEPAADIPVMDSNDIPF